MVGHGESLKYADTLDRIEECGDEVIEHSHLEATAWEGLKYSKYLLHCNRFLERKRMKWFPKFSWLHSGILIQRTNVRDPKFGFQTAFHSSTRTLLSKVSTFPQPSNRSSIHDGIITCTPGIRSGGRRALDLEYSCQHRIGCN